MTSADSATDGSATLASVVPIVPAWRVDREFDYIVPPGLDVRPGSLVRVGFGGRRVRAVVVSVGRGRPDRDLEPVSALVFPTPVAPPPMIDVLSYIAHRYVVPRARAFSLVIPPRVRVRVDEPARVPDGPAPKLLTRYRGGRALVDALADGRPGAWCLRALPGEDHGRLIAEVVSAAGGRALVAVPEVRYCSLVIDSLARIWPDLARVDSSVPSSERSVAWARLGLGSAPGAGGRAALLAPAVDVNAIVVDEEHHPSFKEVRSPRYDARRVALERARAASAVCVLVSSSPTLETGAAVLDGRLGSIEPDRSEERGARPIIEMVEPQAGRALTHILHERIARTLRAGGRVALLVPGRGYARALWCAECRRSVRCPRCEAGLFFDRRPIRVRCARCGYAERPPDVCPHCGANEFRYVGAGSERLAEQVASSFPRAHVMRVDPDVLEKAEELPDLSASDIYVTTWIGTKAALRPDVALVGVLDADWLIRRPDFRAAERAHQALAEMAEWAGPASDGGRLVIQTAEPNHHALQALARADYTFFLKRELEHRRELSYPPFSELVKVSAVGTSAREDIRKAARTCRGAGGTVLGPIPIPGPEGTWQILAKSPDAMVVGEALRDLVRGARLESRLRIDVDPR
jgi:primosomal protein N' (replication factor Y) (superfamily II helicase)